MSGAPDDSADKPHDPTPSRLQQARRDGDVAQSREASAAAAWAGFFMAAAWVVSTGAAPAAAALAQLLAHADDLGAVRPTDLGPAVAGFLAPMAVVAAVLMLAPAAGVAAALAAQQAIVFAPKRLEAKPSKVSPVANAKKKFGPEGLVEFARSLAKLTAVCVALAALLARRFEAWPGLALAPPAATAGLVLREATPFLAAIVVFSVALGALDLPLVRHMHRKRLRMSNEELTRETKENEGDPAMKHKRREKGRAIARNRMLLDVPDADIVIVNPQHYAVALAWDRSAAGAPVCVAKGVDEIAARIREIAEAAGVPLRSDPPTARALYAAVEIGEEIRPEHYAAVAAAIRFADAMRGKARGAGGAGGAGGTGGA